MRFLDDNHVVVGWKHQDINGGIDSDIISLKNYARCCVLLTFGDITAGVDADIALTANDDVSGTHSVTMNNYTYRKSAGSTSDDSWSDDATITDSKIDLVLGGEITPSDDGCVVVIPLDAADILGAGSSYTYNCLRVSSSDPGQSTTCGCHFILSGPRHSTDSPATAITD